MIDPNLSEEVRITVIATGFDRAAKTQVIIPETTRQPTATPPNTRRTSSPQITLPYDASSQITKEYPPPMTPRRSGPQPAQLIEEPEIDVEWAQPGDGEVGMIERALSDLCDPVPEDGSVRFANGSGPSPVDGTPIVHPSERKRAQSRPSMKAVLAGEIDTESELDVPTFIRRHNAQH